MNILPEERESQVRLGLLRILDQCSGYLLPESTLFVHLNCDIAPPVITAEFTAALRYLDGLGAVSNIRPELGGPVKWKITDKGRALLAEALH
jgi:hypothetical protein